ncbi:hypothetical protein CNE_BB1p06610 (plasmid) [Cupriavidus necator N-1]|uniref:Uncharacterized protein n=1 Tax=Cupriavidus necator (strain ATCC 43291 / DSM 13513 / CCUG 52238 / LMG 8453 / N-1) TaxID=1042878 RepID=F8GXL1_CUPNN|nr:hypothetical protein [Cupriavidus necator]AEI82081.1 hypothetical protein CNE_BB1p06610 [Cupriavidus necator N-1]MDX6008393.1 hypothetical protein [Cupriavidus necator]
MSTPKKPSQVKRTTKAPSTAPMRGNVDGHELTILSVVEDLLPNGSHFEPIEETGDAAINHILRWLIPPRWPADVFAVAATLMEASGCYTEASLVEGHYLRHSVYINEVLDAADEWRSTGQCPQVVKVWWYDLLMLHGGVSLAKIQASIPYSPVVLTLMRLLAVADEASAGVGWISRDKEKATEMTERAALSLLDRVGEIDKTALLPYVPHSICEKVPPTKLTVLPKSLTPSVGCTVRAMSHHLALLPPTSVVQSEWVLPDNGPSGDVMRLLVIPFPFRVDDESFVAAGPTREMHSGAKMQPYFTVKPTWLKRPAVTAKMLRDELIAPLVEQAIAKFGSDAIDGVLFPECALTEELASQLLDVLARRPIPGLKFLITGTMAAGEPGHETYDGQPGRNRAKTMVFARGNVKLSERVLYDKAHSKHHRWALDKEQIKRYGLTGVPSPAPLKVWEHIAVDGRQLPFLALRDDLCMTVLICEDLARADPAMPVIRSVGPNLVVALLMDGPQLAVRWPGRYATVLAEDPGSSVLSITSAGMVDRSNLGERNPARAVGLWRHDQGANTELYLPADHHGLVLTVIAEKDEQYSLDHRTDLKTTRRWKLETVTPLAVAADWL